MVHLSASHAHSLSVLRVSASSLRANCSSFAVRHPQRADRERMMSQEPTSIALPGTSTAVLPGFGEFYGRTRSTTKLRRALEAAGVEFIDDGAHSYEGGPGVRLRSVKGKR